MTTVRDERRLFTRSQRAHMYQVQDGRCARCSDVLEEGWHAHHVEEWSRGGLTETRNGVALCPRCHEREHMKPKLREWQESALERCRDRKFSLVEATPGAGKTHLAAAWSRELLNHREITHVVVVVPTNAIKQSVDVTFHTHGIRMVTSYRKDTGAPRQAQGIALTYQDLASKIDLFETWARNGSARIAFVFDEVHHAGDDNVWGGGVNRCCAIAVRTLSMSGTPFRTDGSKIACVRYDESGKAQPDYRYTYREAVADRTCRPVWFHDSKGVARILDSGEVVDMSIDAETRDAGLTANRVMRGDTAFLRGVLADGIAKLDELRRSDPDAAMLVICQPGQAGGDEDWHTNKVRDVLRDLTGDRPRVVTYRDEQPGAKIEAFRKSSERFIVSVRMVSEGVDIPRVRVIALASAPQSELLFRQIVGRAVRFEKDGPDSQDAFVFMPQTPELDAMAKRIMEEAEAGLRDRVITCDPRPDGDDEIMTPIDRPRTLVLEATHELGQVIHSGDSYDANFIKRVSDVAAQAGMGGVTSELLRAFCLWESKDQIAPAEQDGRTWEERSKQYRDTLNRLVRQVAHHAKIEHKKVWVSVRDKVGHRDIEDLLRNHDEGKTKHAIAFLEAWLLRETTKRHGVAS